METRRIAVTAGHATRSADPAGRIFATPEVQTEVLQDGGLILRSAIPLGSFEPSAGGWLRGWATKAPERVFLAERKSDGDWATLTYGEAFRAARAVGQALLDRRLSPARPVVVLSGNSIDHAVLMLGSYLVGVPISGRRSLPPAAGRKAGPGSTRSRKPDRAVVSTRPSPRSVLTRWRRCCSPLVRRDDRRACRTRIG